MYEKCYIFTQREMYIMHELHGALEQDALASSHPLSVPQENIQSTSQIIEMFDVISYYKVDQNAYKTSTDRYHHPVLKILVWSSDKRPRTLDISMNMTCFFLR